MKSLIILLRSLLCISLSHSLLASHQPFVDDEYNLILSGVDTPLILENEGLRSEFQSWATKFKKKYSDSKLELERFAIWLRNHYAIERHNNKIPASSFQLGHNHFSDLTNEEFRKLNNLGEYSLNKLSNRATQNEKDGVQSRKLSEFSTESSYPTEVDWVKEGAVTPIKNQGRCGCCWAFSTTGAIEGAKFIKSGELVSLSEQMLLDCDNYDNGCDGGIMDGAFSVVTAIGGLCSEKDYLYEAKQKIACIENKCEMVEGSKVKKYKDLGRGDDKGLMHAVSHQPVSAGIVAYKTEFQLYKSGVFDYPDCGTVIDHAILIVGYGTHEETGLDFWKVKNSWGNQWGEEGYIRITRAKTNRLGECGILTYMTYPTLD